MATFTPKTSYPGRRVEEKDVGPVTDISAKSTSKMSEGKKQSKKHVSTGKGQN